MNTWVIYRWDCKAFDVAGLLLKYLNRLPVVKDASSQKPVISHIQRVSTDLGIYVYGYIY